ncbi:DinB family protein [Jidongwangia harbinensis]|uniref:DinB family protein n=1 Tax=Jidongwangia harbinensis TaxID=2878561 RepID=UPI001CDA0385|nr:DinB family protein [Jidongwangia harbinensis]MCA2216688.1 DinB family protein [Jidongwangia harbinensis]
MRQPPWTPDLRARLDALLDQHRWALHDCLNRLTEDEARASLVPSRTTLLGLVKHATYVERFYFDHAITGRTLKELGVASTPTRSFVLTRQDTIESVRAAHRAACVESRRNVAALGLDAVVTGRKVRSVWAIYLQMLSELAQHCGHADILREQILSRRRAASAG